MSGRPVTCGLSRRTAVYVLENAGVINSEMYVKGRIIYFTSNNFICP